MKAYRDDKPLRETVRGVIGDTLFQRRRELGWTMEKAAEELDLSVRHYSNLECGRTGIGFKSAKSVRKVFGIDLLTLEEDPPKREN